MAFQKVQILWPGMVFEIFNRTFVGSLLLGFFMIAYTLKVAAFFDNFSIKIKAPIKLLTFESVKRHFLLLLLKKCPRKIEVLIGGCFTSDLLTFST